MPRTDIVTLKQLGDVVCLAPAVAALAERGETVSLTARQGLAPLLELLPGLAPSDATNRAVIDDLLCVDWSSRAALASLRIRARRKRLLVNKGRHVRLMYRWIFDQIDVVPRPATYWGLYFWRYVTGADLGFHPPRLNQPPQNWAPDVPLPANYVLFHPTAAWPIKYWPADSCAAAIAGLREIGVGPVLMSGGAAQQERDHCAAIRARAPDAVIDLAGRTDLKGFLYLVSRARLVLAVDGSAAHLGPAFGRPTLALFGPTDYRSWHYETPLSRRLSTAELLSGARLSLDHIPVERIVTLAHEIMGDGAQRVDI
jgi:ADP-heptose:LPS heptosyltransferase